MNRCICFPKNLSSTESSLAMAEELVEDRVTDADFAATDAKSARQSAKQLESDSQAVSLEELDGKLCA